MITQQEFELARKVKSYDEYVRLNFGDAYNVIYTVAKELGLPKDWHKLKTRQSPYVIARVVSSYVLRKFFGIISSSDLGSIISTKEDHSVIYHYWHRAEFAFSSNAIWTSFGDDFKKLCKNKGYDDKLKDILIRFDDIYTEYSRQVETDIKNIEKSLDKSE